MCHMGFFHLNIWNFMDKTTFLQDRLRYDNGRGRWGVELDTGGIPVFHECSVDPSVPADVMPKIRYGFWHMETLCSVRSLELYPHHDSTFSGHALATRPSTPVHRVSQITVSANCATPTPPWCSREGRPTGMSTAPSATAPPSTWWYALAWPT